MTTFRKELCNQANAILDACKARGVKLATVESCTGGLLSAILTELPGSSGMFTHGFITYSNEAKTELVGVPASLIQAHGAVSEPVARAMAEGALKASSAWLAVSITGIAGPDGGSTQKPVGTVHLAAAMAGKETLHRKKQFSGDRAEIRLAAVEAALGLILSQLQS